VSRARLAPALAAALLAASCAGQCGARGGLPPGRPPTVTGPDGEKYHLVDKGAYKAFYDAWGRLQRIEYDSNGDGRPDHIALHAGKHHPYEIDVDADFDGKTDRWELYDDEGKLVKIGTARAPGLAPNLWTSAGAPGQPERREHDEDGDGRMERVEISREGKVAEVEVDGDRDGRIDRWQRWENGRLVAEDLDTDRDGKADRTVRYDPRGKVLALEPIAPR
jgi:hypothetical protein